MACELCQMFVLCNHFSVSWNALNNLLPTGYDITTYYMHLSDSQCLYIVNRGSSTLYMLDPVAYRQSAGILYYLKLTL